MTTINDTKTIDAINLALVDGEITNEEAATIATIASDAEEGVNPFERDAVQAILAQAVPGTLAISAEARAVLDGIGAPVTTPPPNAQLIIPQQHTINPDGSIEGDDLEAQLRAAVTANSGLTLEQKEALFAQLDALKAALPQYDELLANEPQSWLSLVSAAVVGLDINDVVHEAPVAPTPARLEPFSSEPVDFSRRGVHAFMDAIDAQREDLGLSPLPNDVRRTITRALKNAVANDDKVAALEALDAQIAAINQHAADNDEAFRISRTGGALAFDGVAEATETVELAGYREEDLDAFVVDLTTAIDTLTGQSVPASFLEAIDAVKTSEGTFAEKGDAVRAAVETLDATLDSEAIDISSLVQLPMEQVTTEQASGASSSADDVISSVDGALNTLGAPALDDDEMQAIRDAFDGPSADRDSQLDAALNTIASNRPGYSFNVGAEGTEVIEGPPVTTTVPINANTTGLNILADEIDAALTRIGLDSLTGDQRAALLAAAAQSAEDAEAAVETVLAELPTDGPDGSLEVNLPDGFAAMDGIRSSTQLEFGVDRDSLTLLADNLTIFFESQGVDLPEDTRQAIIDAADKQAAEAVAHLQRLFTDLSSRFDGKLIEVETMLSGLEITADEVGPGTLDASVRQQQVHGDVQIQVESDRVTPGTFTFEVSRTEVDAGSIAFNKDSDPSIGNFGFHGVNFIAPTAGQNGALQFNIVIDPEDLIVS